MTCLVDTNIISELTKAKPNEAVVEWWRQAETSGLIYLSTVTIGEIKNGLCGLQEGSRRRRVLELWLEKMIDAFRDNIIPFGLEEAQKWGEVMASEAARGRPKPDMDTQIAATALVHGLTVVTRNVSDFDISHLKVVNPFKEGRESC